MHQHRITPYEGQEPFIFISYAHKDSDRVLPVIEALNRRSYRVWYDDGIAPGSEWPENIAQHLHDSALIIAFVSPNSIASANCRREVTFALSKRKPFLGIILEETEMSLGMEMQLSAQQCIMKYQYQSEERFMEKICSCPDILPCLIPQAVQPEPEKEAETAAVEAPVPEELPQRPEPEQKEEQPLAAPEKKVRAPKAKKEKTVKPKADKKRRRKVLLLILGIVAVVLALCITLPLLSRVKITEHKTVDSGAKVLTLSQETVTADTVRQINRLKKLQYITFNQCTFEPGALAVLKLPKEMLQIEMKECSGVEELGFLSELSSLRYLVLPNCSLRDDKFPQLQMPDLQKLDISGNTQISKLSFCIDCTALEELNASYTGVDAQALAEISGLPLSELSFAGTNVTDVAALRNMDTLRVIDGSNTPVTSIDVLADLRELGSLNFGGCTIKKVRKQFSCLRLQELYLQGNPLDNVNAFSDCTILERVDFSGTNVSDISFLEKSAATLEMLGISNCPIAWLQLELVKKCPELDTLYMDGINTPNLTFLTNAKELEVLSAVDCGIADISALANCPKLTDIYLAQNRIVSIAALKNLENGRLVVDLSFNNSVDCQALEGKYCKILCLAGTEIVGSIPCKQCDILVVSYSDALLSEWAKELRCGEYWVIGCPADKQVRLEDHLGVEKLCLVKTYKELAKLMEQAGLNADYLQGMK